MTIKLRKTQQGWMAQFIGDAAIIELFGTDTIATPFTATAPAEKVMVEISKRNPGAHVIVA